MEFTPKREETGSEGAAQMGNAHPGRPKRVSSAEEISG